MNSTSHPEVRPHLPSHYYVWHGGADPSGEETLYFASGRRRLTLRGRQLHTVQQRVLPLLDGSRTVDAVASELTGVLTRPEIETCLQFLAGHGLLVDENLATTASHQPRLEPQLNWLHELQLGPQSQNRLDEARVTVIGLAGPGIPAVLALASAHIGHLNLVDSSTLCPADIYFAPALPATNVGMPRVDAVAEQIALLGVPSSVSTTTGSIQTEDAALAAIHDADFVICCADPGMRGTLYRVNRACLRTGTPWTTSAMHGVEGILGPTVRPGQTACYLCYTMRAVACASNPKDALAFERFLDARGTDDSARRENLTFAAGILGNMVALEAFRAIIAGGDTPTMGHVVFFDLLSQSSKSYLVLRKPWCPACFGHHRGDATVSRD